MQVLIMAAGMGSRFGGLKQIEPLGPNGEFIIDYSVFDAIKTGFSKVVFVIKEENYSIFKETIGKRIEPYIDVEYVFQKLDDVFESVKIPNDRVKPWGTAHAVYCARNNITEDFLVINADDFYGRDAFLVAKKFLEENSTNKISIIGYKAENTMTENGSVKRGIIKLNNGNLKSITESKIEYVLGKIQATSLESNEEIEVKPSDLVSMNMITFDTAIFDYIKEKMAIFFEKNKDNLSTCEFLIPTILDDMVKEGKNISVLRTDATWYGVTYKEDTDKVRKALNRLVSEGYYPNNLWN